MKTIRLEDVGVDIRLQVKNDDGNIVDISTAAIKEYQFIKPDRNTYKVNADFVTDGKDGLLSYITVIDEINQEGLWELQLYIVFNAGSFHSTKIRFRVESIIN